MNVSVILWICEYTYSIYISRSVRLYKYVIFASMCRHLDNYYTRDKSGATALRAQSIHLDKYYTRDKIGAISTQNSEHTPWIHDKYYTREKSGATALRAQSIHHDKYYTREKSGATALRAQSIHHDKYYTGDKSGATAHRAQNIHHDIPETKVERQHPELRIYTMIYQRQKWRDITQSSEYTPWYTRDKGGETALRAQSIHHDIPETKVERQHSELEVKFCMCLIIILYQSCQCINLLIQLQLKIKFVDSLNISLISAWDFGINHRRLY